MRILSFQFTYFDHATGERRPVPAGTVAQISTPTWGYPPTTVTITVEGVFPETTGIDADPAGVARVAVANIRGCAEYQLRKLVP